MLDVDLVIAEKMSPSTKKPRVVGGDEEISSKEMSRNDADKDNIVGELNTLEDSESTMNSASKKKEKVVQMEVGQRDHVIN